MLDPVQVLHTFTLGRTLANRNSYQVGGRRGGGISQVSPFNLHVRARSCRAITTATLYQLHRCGSVKGRRPRQPQVADKRNGTYEPNRCTQVIWGLAAYIIHT